MKNELLIFLFGLSFYSATLLNGQNSDNCFLEYSGTKIAKIPPSQSGVKTSKGSTVIITVEAADTVARASDYVYGTNANIYSGRYNQEPKLMEYIELLSPNIIRYPGGLHSNEYFWNSSQSNFPSDLPEKLLIGYNNESYDPFWVGGFDNSYQFGLEDYYEFLEETGCEGLITVNYSYARYGTGPTPVQAAAKLAADWVRYDDGRTIFWEIGNENCNSWASGYRIDPDLNQDGQPVYITPKLYGEHVKVFIDSMKNAADEINHTIYIGAQNDRNVLEGAGNSPDWLVDHTYFTPYQQNSSISAILNSVENEIKNFSDKRISETEKWGTDYKPNTLTEWNIFACQRNQRSSHINGMHAVIVLGEMIKYNYGMANRWDIANGWGDPDGNGPEVEGDDLGMFSRGDDPDGEAHKWNPRAPFFYMFYFQRFFGDHMIHSSVSGNNDILSYASRFTSGEMGVIVVNKSQTEQVIQLLPNHFGCGEHYYIYSLTGGTDNGDFSYQVFVNGAGPETQLGGPIEDLEDLDADRYMVEDIIKFDSPGLSVQYILIEKGDIILSVDEQNQGNVGHFRLFPNYPNPFNPVTQIHYALNKTSHVTIKVYDVLGQRVTTLVNQKQPKGYYNLQWDGTDQNNNRVSSGIYICKLQTKNYSQIQKMILTK